MTRKINTRSVLREKVRDVLAWAPKVIRAAARDTDRWTPPGSSDDICRPFDKLLNEAALLALIGQRAVGDDPVVHDLLDAIAEADEALERIYELIRWHPYNWHSLGTVWIVLDRFGRGNPARRAALRELWTERDQPVPRERSPFRLLDQAWVRGIALGVRDPLLDSRDLLSCTSFGHPAGAIFMAPADLYAFTHTPMYLSDFGRRGRVDLAPGWCGALGLWRLLIGDLDLAAELAMTEVMTAATPDQPTLAIIAALAQISDTLGLLPAPTFRAADHVADGSPEDYLLFHSYHTTFVWGLLCALLYEMRPDDDLIGSMLLGRPSEMPPEWHKPGTPGGLAADIAHSQAAWTAIAQGRGLTVDEPALLRGTLDAWLLEANSRDQTEDMMTILAMRQSAGGSPVDDAVRALMVRRARMKDAPALADALIAHAA